MKSLPKPRVQLNSRLLPVLVSLLLVMQLAFPYKGWLILLTGLVGVWLIGYAWTRSLARGLQLNREMRFGWAQVGDRLEERFKLTNTGWAPGLWVEIVDRSTMPGYRPGRVTGIGSRAENQWKTQGVCARRGLFTLGPTTLHTGDPFGLFTVSLPYPDSVTLTVTPPIVPLPTIEVAPGGRVGEGHPHPDAMEHTISAAGVRAYVPGDSLNRIHWPTSARHNSLFVRLFDSTPAGDWWIILDMDRQVQAGQGQHSTEEHSVILAASLADRGLRWGRAVGLVAHGQELAWLPPQEHDIQRQRILQALALLNPGPCSLAEILTRARPSFGRIASLIVITAAVDGAWVEALTPLLQRGGVATVLLLDPVSFGGSGDISGVLALLTDLGVARHVITRDLLDRPEARPGQRGQWEWRISLTGRAVPVRRPRTTAWRSLGR